MELFMTGWMYGALTALVCLGALLAWVIIRATSERISRRGHLEKPRPRTRTVVYRRHPIKESR